MKKNTSGAVLEVIRLSRKIIKVLDVKSRAGCRGNNRTWVGFHNGNGIEFGTDIERLIKQAKKILAKYEFATAECGETVFDLDGKTVPVKFKVSKTKPSKQN